MPQRPLGTSTHVPAGAPPLVAQPRSATTDLALVATFAALVAVCSLLSAHVAAVPVPVTLQTFAVLLAGGALGARRGALAVLLYLTVGLAGLPVFAGGSGGLAVLAGPSAGYLLAFPLAAAVTGALMARWGGRGLADVAVAVAAALAGTLVVYCLGVPVMAWRADLSLGAALRYNALFLPVDLLKVALVALTVPAVRRAFPDLLPRRRARVAVPA